MSHPDCILVQHCNIAAIISAKVCVAKKKEAVECLEHRPPLQELMPAKREPKLQNMARANLARVSDTATTGNCRG